MTRFGQARHFNKGDTVFSSFWFDMGELDNGVLCWPLEWLGEFIGFIIGFRGGETLRGAL